MCSERISLLKRNTEHNYTRSLLSASVVWITFAHICPNSARTFCANFGFRTKCHSAGRLFVQCNFYGSVFLGNPTHSYRVSITLWICSVCSLLVLCCEWAWESSV